MHRKPEEQIATKDKGSRLGHARCQEITKCILSRDEGHRASCGNAVRAEMTLGSLKNNIKKLP